MSQLAERIAQFRKMAQDDPENDWAHFQLGQLLMEAGQFEPATTSFRRALELTPEFSKAYQFLGNCLVQLNRRDEAIETLRKGYQIADERGNNLPRDEMGKLLTQLGEALPVTAKKAAGGPKAGAGAFQCQRPGCLAGAATRPLATPPAAIPN